MIGAPDESFDLPGKRRRATLSLAPLIDVTFILLIFFMLVSQFTRLAPVDVSLGTTTPQISETPPQSAAGNPPRATLQLHANGGFMVNGKHFDASLGLAGAIGLVKAYFEDATASQPTAGKEKHLVLLDPDPGVNLQQLIDALLALRAEPDFAVDIVMAPVYRQLAPADPVVPPSLPAGAGATP